MNQTERPVKVVTEDKDGISKSSGEDLVLFVDVRKGWIGVRDSDGLVFKVPLSDVNDLIRSNL